MASIRIKHELEEIRNAGIANCNVIRIGPINNNLHKWDVVMVGPSKTPYADGLFRAEISFPPEYPFKPFEMTWKTKIYHLSLEQDHKVDKLFESWTPCTTVSTTLISFYVTILSCTNAGQVKAISDLKSKLMLDPDQFFRTAREWTLNYATAEALQLQDASNPAYDSSQMVGCQDITQIDAWVAAGPNLTMRHVMKNALVLIVYTSHFDLGLGAKTKINGANVHAGGMRKETGSTTKKTNDEVEGLDDVLRQKYGFKVMKCDLTALGRGAAQVEEFWSKMDEARALLRSSVTLETREEGGSASKLDGFWLLCTGLQVGAKGIHLGSQEVSFSEIKRHFSKRYIPALANVPRFFLFDTLDTFRLDSAPCDQCPNGPNVPPEPCAWAEAWSETNMLEVYNSRACERRCEKDLCVRSELISVLERELNIYAARWCFGEVGVKTFGEWIKTSLVCSQICGLDVNDTMTENEVCLGISCIQNEKNNKMYGTEFAHAASAGHGKESRYRFTFNCERKSCNNRDIDLQKFMHAIVMYLVCLVVVLSLVWLLERKTRIPDYSTMYVVVSISIIFISSMYS